MRHIYVVERNKGKMWWLKVPRQLSLYISENKNRSVAAEENEEMALNAHTHKQKPKYHTMHWTLFPSKDR